MKQVIRKIALSLLAAACMAPATLLAQKEEKDVKVKKEAEQIIITRKGDSNEKIVIEVTGDKVIVNGKEIDSKKEGDISVRRNKIRDVFAYGGNGNIQAWNSDNNKFRQLERLSSLNDENRAMLGVTTEKADKGVKVHTVTDESAADKAGIKEGDIITKIGDKSIETPDDLSEAIKGHKPGDKVAVTYSRDKKENKVTAELSKWKGVNIYTTTGDHDFNFTMPDINFESLVPRMRSLPGIATVPGQQAWSWSGNNGPRLGLSIQDTEEGNGVKVLEADEDGNGAKAGIKEGDIITEVDGKAVKSTDEVAKIMRENKDKAPVKMKLLRNGKTENVEIKIPRRLKTTDL